MKIPVPRAAVLAPLAAVLALASPRPASALDALTLEEAVSLAVKNNPTLLSSEQDVIIAKQRVREARFISMPQLALSGTFSSVSLEYPMILGPELGDRYLDPSVSRNFYTMRAYALQPLYTGGRNKNTLRLAKTARNQAVVNFETVRTDAIYEAKKAFYTLLFAKERLDAALRQKTLAAELAGRVRGDPWEAMEARMTAAELGRQAELAAREAEEARSGLARVLNREPSERLDAAGEFSARPSAASPQSCLVTAMEMRSEMKSEIYKAQMDDIAVNMAMIRRYPNVYLGASYDLLGYSVDSLKENSIRANNWAASVAIHFPLSYDIWTQVAQRRAQQRQGDLKRVELQDRIRFEVLSAHKDMAFWNSETLARKASLESAERDYAEASRTRPSAGMPAMRALVALGETRKSYLESVYRQLMARIRLEWAQGRDLDV